MLAVAQVLGMKPLLALNHSWLDWMLMGWLKSLLNFEDICCHQMLAAREHHAVMQAGKLRPDPFYTCEEWGHLSFWFCALYFSNMQCCLGEGFYSLVTIILIKYGVIYWHIETILLLLSSSMEWLKERGFSFSHFFFYWLTHNFCTVLWNTTQDNIPQYFNICVCYKVIKSANQEIFEGSQIFFSLSATF